MWVCPVCPDMTEPATATGRRSVPGRVFGVVTDGMTYRRIAYLVLRFPFGIAYFTAFVTGLALGTALVPLGVGIPILAAVLGLADHVALVEAGLLRRLLGREVAWEPADLSELPVWPYLKTVGTDPRCYLLVAFFLATFFVGTFAFVAVTVAFTLALVYLLAPVLFWLPGVNYGGTGVAEDVAVDIGSVDLTVTADAVGIFAVDTLPEALVASLFGAVLGLVALHLFNAAGRVHAAVAQALLTR
jgi:hypothetical protein